MTTDTYTIASERILDTTLTSSAGVRVGAANRFGGDAAFPIRISTGAPGTLAQVATGGIGANSLFGTGIGPTLVDIIASSRQSGVSSVPGSTQALGLPIGQHTLSMGSTVLGLARMSAIVSNVRFWAEAALGFIADGVSGTIGAGRATHDGYTSHTWIWVGDGALRAAAGVSSTLHIDALSSQSALARTRSAFVHIHTLGVRVSRESRGTGTGVSAGAVRAGGIVATAAEGSVHYIALVDVHTSRGYIARIVGPSLFADTVGLVLIRFAIGVGSTPHILARLLAGHPRWTAHISSLTVTAIGSGSIQALGMGSANVRVGATLIDVHTTGSDGLESVQTEALVLNTLGIVGAVEVAAAQDIHVHLFAGHLGIGFPIVSLRAFAVVAGYGVLAHRMLSTRLIQRRTLVDVHTSAERISGVVRLAGAHETANRIRADRVLPARIVLTLVDVYGGAGTGISVGEGAARFHTRVELGGELNIYYN